MAKEPRTPKQARFKQRSRNAVLGALGAAIAYAVAVDTFGKDEDEDEDDDDS